MPLVLVQTADQRFYETFFDDAQQLGQALELILTSKESGIPEVGRVVAAGFPVKSMDKYLESLRQSSSVVLVEGESQVTLYPQVVIEAAGSETVSTPNVEASPEPIQEEPKSPKEEVPEFSSAEPV